MRNNRPSHRWLYLAAFSVAVFALLFMATGAVIWHTDAPGSAATCPICHLAHISALRGAPAGALLTPAPVAWFVPAVRQLAHAGPSALISPPRAPPA
jgi:hypothetical protein